MHFKKPRIGAAALTVLMLVFFFVLFIVNIVISVNAPAGKTADPDIEAAANVSQTPSDGEKKDDESESEPASVTYAQVFARGFDVRRIEAVRQPHLPEGCGEVIEETFEPGFDFSSADGLVKVTDKTLREARIDVDAAEAEFKPQSGAPTVVIYHTHTTEGYAQRLETYYPLGIDGIAKSPQTGVVAAGSVLKNELARRGVRVVHITETFDSPSRSGSFARSKAALNSELTKLDRVDLVIDLHRGVIQQTGGARQKPTVYLNGYRAAQMRLTACLFESVENGQLAAALTLQRRIAEISPLLCMPVSLVSQTYNFDIEAPAVMIEIGTDRNTADEAKLSAAVLAQAIYDMLTKE